MPVHVGVALLAAETEDVDTLGRHDVGDGTRDAMHDALELEVLVQREVLSDGLAMLDRRDQYVATLDLEGR